MQLQFNAASVQPLQPMDPIPDAWYHAILKSVEGKPVDGKPNAGYLAMQFEVTQGAHAGRIVYHNLNVWSDSQKAVEMAFRELSAICYATGYMVIQQDASELCNRPLQIRVVVEPRGDDPTKSRNTIKGYKDPHGNDPGKSGAAMAAPQPAAMPPAMPPTMPPAMPPTMPAAAPAPAFQQAPAPAFPPQQPPAFQQAPAPAFQQAPAPAFQPAAAAPAPAFQQAPAQAPAAAPWGAAAPAGGAAPAAGGGAPWAR